MKKIYLLLLSFVILNSFSTNAQSTTIVISQVYGGAGCGTAGCSTFKNDFIELFNLSASPVSINGWSIQYASATGTAAWTVTALPNVTIQPGQYYLVAQAFNANGVNTLPTPDVTGTIAMSATAGKVALRNNTTALSGACPLPDATVIDLVGYGSTANCSETSPAPAPSTTTADIRGTSGCTETNNNSTNFTAATPNPRNTASTFNPCGGGGSPTLVIAAGTNAVEGSTPTSGSFTLTFSPATTASTTFNYTLNTGTSTFNTDYTVTLSGGATPSPLTTATGVITVPALVSVITATITPNDDALTEGTETVIFAISGVSGGYSITPPTSATITIFDDESTSTSIHTIQGSGSAAFAGPYNTTGIVTGIYPTLSPAGFYMEEPNATWDADPNTSEGIFVVSNASVSVGDLVKVTGTVQENATSPSFNQAVFAMVNGITVISTGNPIPTAVDVTLPVTATTDYEKYEGMLVRFPGTLTVTDNNNLGSFGEVKLSAGGLVYQPTQVIDPNDNPPSGTSSSGSSNVPAITALVASNNLRTILLDDGRAGTMPSLPYVNGDNTLRVGSTIDNITGILGFAFSQYRIQPTPSFASISFNHAARPTVPGYGVGANVKVASLNVLNYFNGNGAGGGFPTTRGAHSLAEFNRQRDKIIDAIVTMNADVVGLIEMENLDLNDATPALVDLVNGLNAIMGAGTYSFIDDDLDNNGAQDNGTDQIRCAIIYKSTVVSPVGAAMLGNDPVFDRPPLAQTFNVLPINKTFNFIVNHFKSKGGTGTGLDADIGDGQAAFNNRRKLQSNALLAFISATVIPTSGTDRILTVGDYNAYYEEDPMDILRANNYSVLGTATSYSYLFAGQVGSLDHAVTSPSLTGLVTAISKWNANSVEPEYLDYNDAINDGGGDVVNPWASTYTVSPWRSGDHDAILIGLNLPITLPISLVNFTAIKENNKSKITWTTSQEINSREFIVERSTNGGTNWLTVATVPAAGNSNSAITYTVLDASPSKGVNLYRLRSVDNDARFTYSAIRKVNFDSKYTFTIYPNPVTDLLQISVDNATGFNANVQVLNAQGQILINKQWVSNSQLMQVDASTLPSGMYYIKIITADGAVSMQKFSKQ